MNCGPSKPGNIVVFDQNLTDPPVVDIELLEIDESRTKDEQEAELNGSDKELICYGTLICNGSLKNVAALR